MKEIVINMLIEWAEPTDADTTMSLERVLWYDPRGETVIVIHITDPNSLPTARTRQEIQSAFEQGNAFHRDADPYAELASLPSDIPAKHLELRDMAWKKICRLVTYEPDIYSGDRRMRLILNDEVASKAPVDKIYKYLRKYWKRGMTPNALLPDFGRCGAPGKGRVAKNGVKLGRKPKLVMIDPVFIGVNVDDSMKNIFSIAIKQFFCTTEQRPLRNAYGKMIEKHFNLGFREQGGVKIPIMPPAHLIPTFGQFSYWYNKQKNLVHSIVSRMGQRAYVLRHRPVLGSSTQMAFGPGSIFQIDATIADIYLVCSYDRSRIIGRPVVYLCMDVFSRLYVGLYVGFEGPSWLTGMMALENATADKVAFCAEYGIQITEDDWPCHFLPEQILADRGEFIGISSDNLVKNLNIPFANCPPFRGDLKGIIERSFRTSNDTFIRWIPGAVRTRERGDPDYRLEAKLTPQEFTRILIMMMIEYNLFHRIKDYPLEPSMMRDGLEPIPIELWNWGTVNRTGHLRVRSQEMVKLALLPKAEAVVTLQGIRCNGMYYSCERAIREQWFVKARQSRWSIEASYDPRKTEIIYLNLGKGTLETCQLLPREERFKDFRVEEVEDYMEEQKLKSALHESRRMQSRAEFNAFTESIVANATKLTKAANPESLSKRERTSNIRSNRQDEKERVRREEAWDMREGAQGTEKTAPAKLLALPVTEDSTGLTTSRKKKFLEVIERSQPGDDE